jgi:hypothetical protein
MNINLLIGLLAALVSVLGWFITNYLEFRKGEKNRRIQESLKYLQEQIEDFYGPLFNIITQVSISSNVLENLLRNDRNKEGMEDRHRKILHFFQANYFVPLHHQFNAVIKNKLYLAEGNELPESFYQYSRHAIQEQAQLSLWTENGVDTSDVPGIPYPSYLYNELKVVLDDLMKEYSKQIVASRQKQKIKHVMKKVKKNTFSKSK